MVIIRDKESWLRLLFAFRGTTVAETWPRTLFVTAVAAILTVANLQFGWNAYTLTVIPFTVIGVALSIFLGFRNNTSYSRFWEGRILWGNLVNTTRSFTRQTLTLVAPAGPPETDDRISAEERDELRVFQREIVHRAIAYAHALRHHLRNSDPFPELQPLLPAEDWDALREHRNVPLAILQQIGERLHWAWRRGWIRDYHLPVLEGSLTAMTDVQGGCERIKGTPIPFVYTVLMHRVVALYCFFLPLGIVQSVGVMTPLVVLLIAHAFFGLDAIGGEIEDPFGTELNDLPLHAISRTIEVNLRQLLGERDVPPFLEPRDNVLM